VRDRGERESGVSSMREREREREGKRKYEEKK
jgi:hypothetical protein